VPKLLDLVNAFKRYKQKYALAPLFLDHPVYCKLDAAVLLQTDTCLVAVLPCLSTITVSGVVQEQLFDANR